MLKGQFFNELIITKEIMDFLPVRAVKPSAASAAGQQVVFSFFSFFEIQFFPLPFTLPPYPQTGRDERRPCNYQNLGCPICADLSGGSLCWLIWADWPVNALWWAIYANWSGGTPWLLIGADWPGSAPVRQFGQIGQGTPPGRQSLQIGPGVPPGG